MALQKIQNKKNMYMFIFSILRNIFDINKFIYKKIYATFFPFFFIRNLKNKGVIPELKLTDRGLVDVNQFKIVDLFEG